MAWVQKARASRIQSTSEYGLHCQGGSWGCWMKSPTWRYRARPGSIPIASMEVWGMDSGGWAVALFIFPQYQECPGHLLPNPA